MSHKLIQVEDIGEYDPNELQFRDGSKVLNVYRNTVDGYGYYSVLYMAGDLHRTTTCNKSGRQLYDKESSKDVFLRYESPIKSNEVTTPANLEFDIGNYTPEQLTLRNGYPVVAVFKNIVSSDKSSSYYSVAYLNKTQHNITLVSKNGKQRGQSQIDDYDVILKEEEYKDLLCEAWDLFTNKDLVLDHLKGLKLNIFRDGSGEITKGYGDNPDTVASFDSLSELIEKLKRL